MTLDYFDEICAFCGTPLHPIPAPKLRKCCLEDLTLLRTQRRAYLKRLFKGTAWPESSV